MPFPIAQIAHEVARRAAENPHQEGHIKFQYLEVGLGMRGAFRELFRQVEMLGGTVNYREHKSFLTTTYTHVRITGPAWLLVQVARNIEEASSV